METTLDKRRPRTYNHLLYLCSMVSTLQKTSIAIKVLKQCVKVPPFFFKD